MTASTKDNAILSHFITMWFTFLDCSLDAEEFQSPNDGERDGCWLERRTDGNVIIDNLIEEVRVVT